MHEDDWRPPVLRDPDTPMPEHAVQLLQEVLELITLYPEIHNQGDWLYAPYGSAERVPGTVLPLTFDRARPTACGTKGCLAGNVFLMSGRHELRYQVDDDDTRELHIQFLRNGVWHDVDPYVQGEAAEILCLTRDEMVALFDGDNSLDDLWSFASLFSDGRVRRPSLEQLQARRHGDAASDA